MYDSSVRSLLFAKAHLGLAIAWCETISHWPFLLSSSAFNFHGCRDAWTDEIDRRRADRIVRRSRHIFQTARAPRSKIGALRCDLGVRQASGDLSHTFLAPVLIRIPCDRH